MHASPELEARLRELTGWTDEFTLGFLIRQLPRRINTDSCFLGVNRGYKDTHFARFNFHRSEGEDLFRCHYEPISTNSSRHWSTAKTPEDAVCMTLISLIESGDMDPVDEEE